MNELKPSVHVPLTAAQASRFATEPRYQVATLRALRRAAMERQTPLLLAEPNACLATCSAAGEVHVHGPLLVARDSRLTLYRAGDATFLGHGGVIVQLEQGGRACLTFVEALPEVVSEIPDYEVTPALLNLAEAGELLIDSTWPQGYYRDGRDLLWSSGERVYRWDHRQLEPEPNPPVRAVPLTPLQAEGLPAEFRSAVERHR